MQSSSDLPCFLHLALPALKPQQASGANPSSSDVFPPHVATISTIRRELFVSNAAPLVPGSKLCMCHTAHSCACFSVIQSCNSSRALVSSEDSPARSVSFRTVASSSSFAAKSFASSFVRRIASRNRNTNSTSTIIKESPRYPRLKIKLRYKLCLETSLLCCNRPRSSCCRTLIVLRHSRISLSGNTLLCPSILPIAAVNCSMSFSSSCACRVCDSLSFTSSCKCNKLTPIIDNGLSADFNFARSPVAA